MHRSVIAIMAALSMGSAAAEVEKATLNGQITEIVQPDTIWIGALEIHLRDAFLLEEKRDEALAFMRALASNTEVECQLSGERLHQSTGPLVARCVIFGPTDGREIDLSARLVERGFARRCETPDAMIAVWPPVYACH